MRVDSHPACALRTAALFVSLAGVVAAQGADNCGSAQPISGTGTFAVNNIGANTDGPSACGSFGRDVWFAWTAPATDDFTFSTCPQASYDTTLAAYSGSCGSLNEIACNDDACNLQSQVSISAMQGTSYLIRVGGFSGASGTATMEVALGGGGSSGCTNPAVGPDVIVGVIPSVRNWGAVGGMGAYSLGTTSCNVGDEELLWISQSTDHPVIGQNIYRMENGRFEQIGMSWLKHGFVALQGTACCSCTPAANGSRLGVGCSDPYGAGLNGSQTGLGPRSEVNPFTGAFSYPYMDQGQSGDTVYKRIQVPNADVSAALHPSAQYFGEAQYITPDDAAAGNGFNNVAWVNLNRSAGSGGFSNLNVSGATNREEAAIYAWQANDPTVKIEEINVPSEGQFIAGSNVIDNGDGTWSYEYAIFNNNSDFSGQSFTMPVGSNVTVTGAGMSFPSYHSGEPYTNVAWTATVNAGSVTWATEPHMMNADANALRWGTTYSFWFTATTAPEVKAASLGLFKPGNPGAQTVALDGPMDADGGSVVITNYCTANPNSTGQTSKILASNVNMTARTMELEAYDLPQNAFGFFVTSLDEAFIPNAGGSAGNLCIGANTGRGVGGGIFSWATVPHMMNADANALRWGTTY
ncbi:MAG: hypothetical protein AAGG01_11630, partial [Planctomycetota bacterium]